MTPLPYCQFWCEENVWHLCEHEAVRERERWVVIVSNAIRQVAMWAQKAATRPGWPLAWDYHVALLVRGKTGWEIWDLDSALGHPVAATTWLEQSFRELPPAARALAPMFRLVAAQDYRREFSSDRSHMLDSRGGYQQAVPNWPRIGQGTNNLRRFVDIDDRFLGEVMNLTQLSAWLSENRSNT
jgi:hypothetical protein